MQQIVDQTKTYEFRKRLYRPTVKRIWFYETAPKSAITYICEILPAHIRSHDDPLPLDGIGNKEYNDRDPTFEGYDYAYRVMSCHRLWSPIDLGKMKDYGIGGAPRGMVYVPRKMMEDIHWGKQKCVWTKLR